MKDIDGIEKALQILKPHWDEIEADFERHNKRFLELAASDHDAIGRVLRAHLIIESFIDTFLVSHYGFEELESLKLSFIQKTKLLPTKSSSAAVVRPGIIQLNAVRNKFGHKLNHTVQREEVTAIIELLASARPDKKFDNATDAIEAFAPVACAFLSVPPPGLGTLFTEAFESARSYEPFAE